MKFSYDKKANAIYVKMSNKRVEGNRVVKSNMIVIDLDRNDKVVGIEFLLEEVEE